MLWSSRPMTSSTVVVKTFSAIGDVDVLYVCCNNSSVCTFVLLESNHSNLASIRANIVAFSFFCSSFTNFVLSANGNNQLP